MSAFTEGAPMAAPVPAPSHLAPLPGRGGRGPAHRG